MDDATKISRIQAQKDFMDQVFANFSLEDAQSVKEIEKTTSHDVKAVKFFLKERLDASADLATEIEYLHFSHTSEDTKNLAYALMLHYSFHEVILPALHGLELRLCELADELAMYRPTHLLFKIKLPSLIYSI